MNKTNEPDIPRKSTVRSVAALIRPYQWIKNLFIFMPLFFGGALTNVDALLHAVLAFFAYSFAASAIYCYNDIIDVEDDRRHSEKCHRPIASGAISIIGGYGVMTMMLCWSAVFISFMGDRWMPVASVVAGYIALDLLYCRLLKHFAIVDVVVLAFGFVLRIIAGSAATGVVASQWLVLMTFLLTLLLGLAKRRDDVLRMQKTGLAPRHNTKRYNLDFINMAVTVSAAVTVVCYIMYTMTGVASSPRGGQEGAVHYTYLTTIFVLLGLLRYMQLATVDNATGDPTKLLYRDHFLQVVIALWFLSYVLILYVL